MKWMGRAWWVGALVVIAQLAAAGEYNPVLSIGDEAPHWKELPGVDGKEHSSRDLGSPPASVVVFTCNSCPYAVEYEQRINQLAGDLKQQGVPLVAINVNMIPEDRLDAMRERAREKGFVFPYLYDASQQIAKDFGALFTPECYVLDSQRRVVYMGALDDSPDASKVTRQHARLAVQSVLEQKESEVTETVPIGCRIRLTRARRQSE